MAATPPSTVRPFSLIRLSIDSELKAYELRNQHAEIMRRAEALVASKLDPTSSDHLESGSDGVVSTKSPG